jgi:hypothetical protein
MAQAQDTDVIVLRDAANAVIEIDVRYREGDANTQRELQEPRDRAFAAFSLARLNLVKAGVITTNADVNSMRAIKAQIDQAAATQVLLTAVVRLISFLIGIGSR